MNQDRGGCNAMDDRKTENAGNEIFSFLKNVTIFSSFSLDVLRDLLGDCPHISKKAGELIIEEGTPASEIYIIISGRVSIILDLKTDPFELAEFGPGDCIGEASVIGVQNHSASARVTEDAELFVLSRSTLMSIYEKDKDVFAMLILNIARELARRLYKTDQVLLHYGKNR
jgi:CRP/FNR family cyclic AMP-dependent transcriptional regulator